MRLASASLFGPLSSGALLALLGRKVDSVEAILRALPATRREIREKTGMTKGAVQNVVEKLHKANWLHVGGHVREWHNGVGKFTQSLEAGPGIDKECELVPLTQKERDDRRYKKLIETGAIVKRVAATRQREKERKLKRKQRLAAWALPLTVVVSKPRPAKSFPESVEREQI